MKSPNETDFDQLPSDLMLKINQLCDRYESELRQGDLPSINAYLDDVAVDYREVILKELIPLDVEHRCQQGETPESSDYLHQFPILDQEWLSSVIGSARAAYPAASVSSSPEDGPHEFDEYSLDQFCSRVVDAGILSERELTELIENLEQDQRPQSAAALAEILLQLGTLTEYQSHALSSSEARPLLIGDYLILEPIGSGGMGTVYKAMHQRMKRIVALKVIRSDLDHVLDRLKRFEREVQAAARLSHPNIVTAYDAGEHQGVHYLICEYIDGESLTQLVRDSGPLDFPDAVSCVLQVTQGLEYAHGRGVIHRDIKPANILVDDQGDLKILDMGLARLQASDDILGSESQTELTSSQFFMGTIDYMAPEQARNTKLADHRSDIYSLGCTLYFLLTAKPVYGGGTTVERILAHKEQPIPRLSATLPQIPVEFDHIFTKMLAKDPEERYQTASELFSDLDQFNTEFLQDQTFTLPVKETLESEPVQENWASAPTEIQPVASEFTVMSAATQQEKQKAHSSSQPRLVWGGVAVAALILGGVLFWNPFQQDPGTGAQNQDSQLGQSGSSDAKAVQTEYAQKVNLPVSTNVPLGAQGKGPELELMLIPSGEFLMGDGSSAEAASDVSVHPVKLTQPFYMGATEITNEQFRRFVEETQHQTVAERSGGFGVTGGSWGKSDAYYWNHLGDLPVRDQAPVVNISWNDAVAFCDWLSKKTGEVYRLPTEAEWEYACRAGSKGPWFFGTNSDELEDHAWFLDNSEGQVYPAKQKQPNPFGLYDLYGNEWEWCQDYYADNYYAHSPLENPTGPEQGSERVRRGGGFQLGSDQLNSYVRGHGNPNSPSRGAFRIVREVNAD
ncbi:bifunctional serine/threonine-protein kinase/formylglycine-generating enzyme family protein [uncultured Gimesia sp.]|uniref:bifunctional serine/threonine-protein kinase/formylglycine-generating enzyme family protein n=1 Tax=uncultured Gimesia sp. TaxID=1678688 RepID=UPI0030DD43CB